MTRLTLSCLIVLIALSPSGNALAHRGLGFTGHAMTADFDGDGHDELAPILRNDPGGSGVFYHLLVIDTDERGAPRAVSAFIGDRVQILNFWADEGDIALDLVEAGPGDAGCCPTHKTVRRWKLKDGGLVELPAQPYGQVGLADLVRLTWRLVKMDGRAVPQDIPIDITVGTGGALGRSGCNRYQVAVKETAPGRVSFDEPVAATQMACPEARMALERRFLQRLSRVNGYRWMGGTLALDWQEGDAGGSLLFRLVED
jgi:heat shock protein HslJ